MIRTNKVRVIYGNEVIDIPGKCNVSIDKQNMLIVENSVSHYVFKEWTAYQYDRDNGAVV